MKTIIIQGTEEQVETFRSSLTFNINKMPKQVETRVYVVENIDSIGDMTDILTENIHYSELSDSDFMELAEQDGRVYSLQGFQDAFNEEEVNTAIDVVRFINVPLN